MKPIKSVLFSRIIGNCAALIQIGVSAHPPSCTDIILCARTVIAGVFFIIVHINFHFAFTPLCIFVAFIGINAHIDT